MNSILSYPSAAEGVVEPTSDETQADFDKHDLIKEPCCEVGEEMHI